MNTELTRHDLSFAVLRLPRQLKALMKEENWLRKIYVGGGYLRAIVSGETVNDVDVFVGDFVTARIVANLLVERRFKDRLPPIGDTVARDAFFKRHIYETDNALTLVGFNPTIQIIHKWTFDSAADVIASFDFTVCCAAICFSSDGWESFCDERFYPDLAAKRLVYRSPVRIEEAGGSALRVLKYYQRGYRIPLDSFGAVLARLFSALDLEKLLRVNDKDREGQVAKVLTGLLRVVDPQVDPLHEAHLPSLPEVENE